MWPCFNNISHVIIWYSCFIYTSIVSLSTSVKFASLYIIFNSVQANRYCLSVSNRPHVDLRRLTKYGEDQIRNVYVIANLKSQVMMEYIGKSQLLSFLFCWDILFVLCPCLIDFFIFDVENDNFSACYVQPYCGVTVNRDSNGSFG